MDRKRQSSVTRENETAFRQSIMSLAFGLKATTMIDIGCGDGIESTLLGKKVGAKKVIGIDHEPTLLETLNARGGWGISANLNEFLPLKNSCIDGIICNQVIEHVAKTDVLMSEMYRILRPGGWAIVCTPNLASWHNVFSLFFGWQPFSSQVSDKAFLGNPLHPNNQQKIDEEQAHLRVFAPKGLKDLALFHGFQIEKFLGAGYYPFPRSISKIFSTIDPLHAAYLVTLLSKKN